MAPNKSHKIDSQLPRGVKNNPANSTEKILYFFRERNLNDNAPIRIYDTRDLYGDNSKEHYRMFYKGDHHWQPEYAFHIFLDLLKYFDKSKFEISEQVSNPNNYSISILPTQIAFWDGIGSQERRTGKCYFDNNDNICMPLPQFHTQFEVFDSHKNETFSGNFEKAICLNIDSSLRRVKNPNLKQGKILLIKDSYALPLFSYFTLISHQVDMIDLRHYEGSVFDYIKQNKPDVVIVAYAVGRFQSEELKPFQFDKHPEEKE